MIAIWEDFGSIYGKYGCLIKFVILCGRRAEISSLLNKIWSIDRCYLKTCEQNVIWIQEQQDIYFCLVREIKEFGPVLEFFNLALLVYSMHSWTCFGDWWWLMIVSKIVLLSWSLSHGAFGVIVMKSKMGEKEKWNEVGTWGESFSAGIYYYKFGFY